MGPWIGSEKQEEEEEEEEEMMDGGVWCSTQNSESLRWRGICVKRDAGKMQS
jgi:hypothetical protein